MLLSHSTPPSPHISQNVHCSTIYNSQDIEATLMSIDKGVDKKGVVYIHNGLSPSHYKE